MPHVVHEYPYPAVDDDDGAAPQFASGTVEILPFDLDEVVTERMPVITTRARDERAISPVDVAAITHDLKNPLSTVALELAVIRECLPEHVPGMLADSFVRIERNLGYVDRLINDLLDLAAIGTTGFTLRRQPTVLTALVEDILERAVATRDRGRFYIDARTPVALELDAGRIERVVCNYLQNALKYAPDGSPIIVRVEQRGAVARVSVIDHGPGLSVEDARHVFDHFHRAVAARAIAGSGLGLYVSRAIIEAHGGRVGVESELGRGARFYFELPLPVIA